MGQSQWLLFPPFGERSRFKLVRHTIVLRGGFHGGERRNPKNSFSTQFINFEGDPPSYTAGVCKRWSHIQVAEDGD